MLIRLRPHICGMWDGSENVVNVCGKAGFGFVENAMCFHKGTRPIEKPRLMLQIEYAINDYGNIHEKWGA